MENFTQDEINFLIRLLRGERWYRTRDFSDPGSIQIGDDDKVTLEHGGYHHIITKQSIKSLADQYIIYLQPCDHPFRAIYMGRWMINKRNFMKHPQYDEVIVQSALGLRPTKETEEERK